MDPFDSEDAVRVVKKVLKSSQNTPWVSFHHNTKLRCDLKMLYFPLTPKFLID